MPWTKNNYPVSMKNLPKAVRDKAVEIANALLTEKNLDEGIAIATGISRAKDWAANHGKETALKSKTTRSTDIKEHGEDRWVAPREEGWAVKKEGSKKAEKIVESKKEAVALATREAQEAHGSVTIQDKSGKVEKRKSFTPHKK